MISSVFTRTLLPAVTVKARLCLALALSIGLCWTQVSVANGSADFLAGQPQSPQTMPERTAAELVQLALANNPGPQALQAALNAAQERIAISGSWPDPMLSWAVAPNTLDNPMLGDRHIIALSQPLPWFGKRELNREVARGLRDAQSQDLVALKLELASRTRSAFARWHYVQQALLANADNQTLIKDLAAVARSSYAAGRASQQALVKAELRRVQLQRQCLALQRDHAQLLAHLQALTNTRVALGHPAALGMPPVLPALAALLDLSRSSNPQLEALAAREAASRSQLERVQRDYFPDFKFNASYVGTLDPPDKRLQVGLAVELPLNVSRRRAQVDGARAEAARTRWAMQERALQIDEELQSSWAAADEADQTGALFAASILPLARQNLNAARADWSSGASEFQSVIDAEEDLLEARLGLEKARADAWMYRAKINQLSGAVLHAELLGDAQE
jgi:cobalt-zinc-cadmium efflux system outer membrane protein